MSRSTHARASLAALAATTALLVAGIPMVAQAQTDTPSIAASPAAATRAELLSQANLHSAAIAQSLGLDGQEKLIAKDVVKDANGTQHLRYERTYAGLPVLGGDLVVHQAANGTIKSVDRASNASLTGVPTTPEVAAPRAQASAQAEEAGSTVAVAPRLVVWVVKNTPKLAWETVVTGKQHDGTPSRLHVVTDARTGEVLSKVEGIETDTGHGVFVGTVPLTTTASGSTFQLKDGSRGGQYTTDMGNGTSGNGTLFTNSTTTWGDGTVGNRQSAAVDAQYGTSATWDFYKNTFGRTGIRNDGVGAYNRVHYDTGYVNAFWDDTCFCMTYGDGASDTHPLTEIDVAGHEMTHGVTAATANLNYSGESGGLNEATSDILGTMVEFSANLPSNPPNYLIGELININGDGTPLRYMDHPSKDGASADSWSSTVGNLDVHNSSGVANHFFYLLSEGSGAKTINGFNYNSPTVNGISVTGIGRDKAAQIWYRALTTYFTSTTDYAGARAGTLSAATDLYGAGSAEYNAVATAWAAVNVGSLPTGTITVANPGNQTTALNGTANLQVSATGGTGALTYSATGLPSGLSISSTGLITGTATTAGTYSVTVTATDTAGKTGTTSFSWTVSSGTGGGGVTNGTFETGNLSGWTSAGSTSAGAAAKHTGSYGAQVGSTSPSGSSSLNQTFTAPAGSSKVSFYYNVNCPDTVTYDWATATLKDNTTNTTTTLLAKTCTSGLGWKAASGAITAGHSYTITLTNVDDNYPGDPTYTYYDDIATS
ncbi:M4 family metallopeptidase [Kitasatospora acidiphila]|uniref:M4 family metallopeptidase n=1 Tax=Kitasatospora acidiphila TaxID=2567942 RepID=A0A540W116_9ACTN|nr:M4 family metallopeptidase [Kitasatospora acidiphila]TQF02706.1 M4 family metallopeptidase [Kitasatospora acidiphila]